MWSFKFQVTIFCQQEDFAESLMEIGSMIW